MKVISIDFLQQKGLTPKEDYVVVEVKHLAVSKTANGLDSYSEDGHPTLAVKIPILCQNYDGEDFLVEDGDFEEQFTPKKSPAHNIGYWIC
jgi:hypothetical protein